MNRIWFDRFIQMAGLVASWSKDPSTKVGCVIVDPSSMSVVSIGFNGFPRGVQERQVAHVGHSHGALEVVIENVLDQKRWSRPEKYQWVEHAERNAVYNAARYGTRLNGCWAFLNYTPTPCAECSRALAQAGITKIIGPDRPWDGNGNGAPYEVGEISRTILAEAGVRVEVLKS